MFYLKFSTILGTNGQNSADVPLSNKETKYSPIGQRRLMAYWGLSKSFLPCPVYIIQLLFAIPC